MIVGNHRKCIWCGRTSNETHFETIAHILPKALGGKEIVADVCDECNHYFGTAPKGTHHVPCMDHAFKEIFEMYSPQAMGMLFRLTLYITAQNQFFG